MLAGGIRETWAGGERCSTGARCDLLAGEPDQTRRRRDGCVGTPGAGRRRGRAGLIMAAISAGTYRIPYQNGTTVEITGDHLTHDPPTRIDMKGVAGSEPYRLVAAADGVIRFIVDQFGANRPDGNPCNNNFVWIEHDNGEWTKYSHMTKRSVTRDAGLSVGQRVRAGTFLGFEDDIGCAHGEHLHFEVAVPIDPNDPIDDGGFIRGGSARNRIPRICGIPSQLFVEGKRYVAANCPALVVHPTVLTFGSSPRVRAARAPCG